MYSRFTLARKYIQYYLTASNGAGHGTHSPFVFEFILRILGDKTNYADFDEVEQLRARLRQSRKILEVEDFGAGSSMSKTNSRTVASIARHAAKPKKYGQLLYRMIRFYQSPLVLELGTSLGITTCYLAKGATNVISMEGSREIADIARSNFNDLRLTNIQLIEGNFDDQLPLLVTQLQSPIGLAFVDGNHRLQPTMRYFETLLPKINDYSIVVLDDIHWSEEMEQAWKYCKEHPAVTLSIDLFFIGILIFRKEIRERQHFVVRF